MRTQGVDRLKYIDLPRLKRTIDEGPYDAVIVMSPEGVPYFSGFWNFDLRGIPERVHFVLWPKHGEPVFIVVPKRKSLLLPSETFIEDVRIYQGEGLDSVRVLAETMQERGLTDATIGIEARSFPGGHLLELQRLLPKLRFQDAYEFLERIRSLKTPAEVEVLTRANRITAAAIETAFRAAKPGDTERAVSARMQAEMLQNGLDMIAFPTFGAADRSGYFHGLATDQRIENGMIIKTDSGGYLEGYYSDLARMGVMGKATAKQRDTHAKVTEIKHRIVHGIRPGMTAAEVAHLGRQAYQNLGLEFKWNILGHGIGLAIHELPQIYTYIDEPILPTMTMMIEVGYTDYPADSYHVEDLILITERGAEYLTDAKAHETLWELGA